MVCLNEQRYHHNSDRGTVAAGIARDRVVPSLHPRIENRTLVVMMEKVLPFLLGMIIHTFQTTSKLVKKCKNTLDVIGYVSFRYRISLVSHKRKKDL